MIPWIAAHAWYGAQIESLTDKVMSNHTENETVYLSIYLSIYLSVYV
jgi:hypothetical protein